MNKSLRIARPESGRAVAVLADHRELVSTQSREYSLFIEALRLEGRRPVALRGTLSASTLADHDALVLGAPPRLRTSEFTALASWVQSGGHLLALATRGGAFAHASFVLGFTARNDCVVVARSHGKHTSFASNVTADVTHLVRRPATLSYPRGCTLELAQHITALDALATPEGAVAVRGIHYDEYEDEDLAEDLTPTAPGGLLFARYALGRGEVCAFGSADAFHDDALADEGNAQFLQWLLARWLPRHIAEEVRARKSRAQRHRLLHGYPMLPVMPEVPRHREAELAALSREIEPAEGRAAIVGVLPHSFCNPSVRGCGFCTFPHETYTNAGARETTALVAREIERYGREHPAACERPIPALYFGGGTANLTPPDALSALCTQLRTTFRLENSEVTLEGVPSYFVSRTPHTLDVLREHLPARHYRISMGIQTFDPAQLARMGRTAFGDLAKIREVVALAHSMGFTASGDLLFDLPGQSLSDMKRDVKTAVDIGLDHVCLYHLVLFDGLGTEWSRDMSLVQSLPDNRAACEHWIALSELLIASGFVQTSLTNFERREVRASPRRFEYEDRGYRPERHDVLGFGPAALSLVCAPDLWSAVKVSNPERAADYARALSGPAPYERAFRYDAWDMRVLFLTRKVVTLSLQRSEYTGWFGTDPVADFPQEFSALVTDRLLRIDGDTIELTPKGMFYADTIAGLFASRRVLSMRLRELRQAHRPRGPRASTVRDLNDARSHGMG